MTAPSGNAQGDNGVYDVRPRLVTLTGHVILTKQKNVMHGNKLVVNMVTGLAQLSSGGGPGSTRVQGLFTPPPASTAPTKPQAPKVQPKPQQTFQP
jgi:lipopolysaccharide export system protein LptA